MYKYLDVTEFVQVLIMKSKTRFISSSNVEKKNILMIETNYFLLPLLINSIILIKMIMIKIFVLDPKLRIKKF